MTVCIGDPRVLFPGGGAPSPPTYVERLPIPQPAEFEDGSAWEVKVTASSVPVKQYADMAAPDVAAPLQKGETFSAPYLVYGRDGKPWWVSRARGRVPKAGTRETSGAIA